MKIILVASVVGVVLGLYRLISPRFRDTYFRERHLVPGTRVTPLSPLIWWAICAIVAVFVMPLISASFQSSDSDLFQAVPIHNRDEVRTSVNNLVSLYKQREWGKIYDLIEEPQSSRDVYIRNSSNTSWTLMEFTPRGVHTLPQSNLGWYVDGCADVIDHGKKAKWAAIIEITSKDDKTYALFKIAAGKRPIPLSCEEAGEDGH